MTFDIVYLCGWKNKCIYCRSLVYVIDVLCLIVYRYSCKQQFKKRQSSQSSLSLFFSLLLDLVMMKSLEFLANKGEYIQAISRSCGTFLEHHWLFYPTKGAIKLLDR